MAIQRWCENIDNYAILAVANIATAAAIPFGSYAGGILHIVSGAGVTLSFYGAVKEGGTRVQIYDSSNAAVARTVATGRAYAIPDECFGFEQIFIVADAALVANINLKS
jgi:hypothetical protein